MEMRFPGTMCCVCGMEIPQGTEGEVHPTEVGPLGGKRYVHLNCGAARMNAGRRTSRGQQKSGRLPRLADVPGPQVPTVSAWHATDLRALSKAQLVALGPEGREELKRRGRNASGTKLAWSKSK